MSCAFVKATRFSTGPQAPEKAPYFSMILLTKGADPWL